MKKLICLFTILAFLGVANSMAQGLHFGLKAGVLGNKANVSGMRNQFKEESLTGFQVGPMLQYQTGFHGIALDFYSLNHFITWNNGTGFYKYWQLFQGSIIFYFLSSLVASIGVQVKPIGTGMLW